MPINTHMLLAVSILLFILSLIVGIMIAWANMMSDAPTVQLSYWPMWLGTLVAVFLGVAWFTGW